MDTFFINPGDQLDENMHSLGQAIREKAQDGKIIEVTFKDAKRLKTIPQNSYYHGLVGLLAKETGNDFKRLRIQFKDSLGYYDEMWVNGKSVQDFKSMADVTVEQSIHFINAVIEVLEAMNIIYPDPNAWCKMRGFKPFDIHNRETKHED